jgi:phage tail-like protein
MDVNATAYFLLRGAADFSHGSRMCGWDERRGAFTLLQAQELRLPRPGRAAALAALNASGPLVRDPFGQIARIAPAGDPLAGVRIQVQAGRGWRPLEDGDLRPVAPPSGRFTDIAVGGSGRLVACWSDAGADRHGLVLLHLGRRWQTALEPGLEAPPRRAIVDADDRVWCVTDGALVLAEGGPLPHPYQPLPARFEPEAVNPRPFDPVWSRALPAGRAPLALCADAERLYLLADVDGGMAPQEILTRPRDRDPSAPWSVWPLEDGIPFVVDLAVLAPGRLAALAPREPGDDAFERRDCPVLTLVQDGEGGERSARLVLERHPMRSLVSARLVSALDGQVRYQAGTPDGDSDARGPRPRELHPLPRPEFSGAARVTLRLGPGGIGLDSGRPDTPWHRVYIDGCIPEGCALNLYARAYEDPAGRTAVPFVPQPAPLWTPLRSELPFHAGLAPSRPGESGLFEVLLQYPAGAARTLRGRYLQLRLVLEGDGRHTPAIHAMRVYAPRFSYQEAYLPELFRQRTGREGPGDQEGPANGADVRERLLAAFEGMLTPLEGRIAACEALLHPDTVPTALMPGLAGALGLRIPPHWPEARRRRLLAEGGLLQQWRGTYPGVRLALDIATDGAVGRGQVVLVENFRLRRTMATLLGLDMDDRDHPLTLGTGMSGNSIVGDSLILSDADSRTFLALLAPELGGDDAAAVTAFFDRYSHRVSVLLHGPARRERALVEEVLIAELPAHLLWRIVETDHPFVLGLSPLLAVDSFLETTPPPRRAVLNDTHLGREGLLANRIALSPEDANRPPPQSSIGQQPGDPQPAGPQPGPAP